MDKTQKLEQRWFKYRMQNMILSTAVTLALLLVALFSYFYFLKKDLFYDFLGKKSVLETSLIEQSIDVNNSLAFVDESNLSVTPPITLKEEKIEAKLTEATTKESLSLAPVIPIIDMEKERYKRSTPRAKRVSEPKTVRAKTATYLDPSELKNIEHARDTTKLKKINLSSSSKNYIETMKAKFLKSKNPREALLLAKVFYKRGAYKESEKWALIANKLDSKQADSWIIFAKSKVKMGQKDEAIKILFTYYKKSKSAKVKAVIEKIKTGEV